MTNVYTSRSPEETIAFGREFAGDLERGDIICLQGDLGAGKTHFVKGIAEALGINPVEVTSPTYTLINEYSGSMPLYHFDCYRMKSPREALEIGIEEYLFAPGVCVIEWPERIESLLPAEAVWITIKAPEPTTRKFVIGKKSM